MQAAPKLRGPSWLCWKKSRLDGGGMERALRLGAWLGLGGGEIHAGSYPYQWVLARPGSTVYLWAEVCHRMKSRGGAGRLGNAAVGLRFFEEGVEGRCVDPESAWGV